MSRRVATSLLVTTRRVFTLDECELPFLIRTTRGGRSHTERPLFYIAMDPYSRAITCAVIASVSPASGD